MSEELRGVIASHNEKLIMKSNHTSELRTLNSELKILMLNE